MDINRARRVPDPHLFIAFHAIPISLKSTEGLVTLTLTENDAYSERLSSRNDEEHRRTLATATERDS